ncbi:ESF1 homolog [Helianthus annuus]|uniref:ESF1 homolog n=1 Tax=Helianthus annuus TaxID=4232 RepID=UPI000B90A052|nr:ESF1 homolog [Helianthus annuus]
MFGDILVFGSKPVSLDDVPDMSFFDDNRTKAVEDRVSKLEKEKAASDEKMKNLEAENVVLNNEVQSLNEKVVSLEAGNVALNEVVQGLVTTNEQLSTSNTMLMSKNEILKKMVNNHKADKKLKSKQIEMLVEAQRTEREKKAAEEAAEATKDKGKQNIIEYSNDDDDEDEDEDEEEKDDGFKAIDDYKDSDDDQGGGGNLQINEERDVADPKGESGSGAIHDEESAGIFTEAVPINSIPADTLKLMERLGITDESFKFDFEEVLEKINLNEAESYVFKNVSEVNDYDNVVMEDDTDSDKDESFHYSLARKFP